MQLRRSSSASPRLEMAILAPFLHQMLFYRPWTILLIFLSNFCKKISNTIGHNLRIVRRRHLNTWTGSGHGVSKTRQNAGYLPLDYNISIFFYILQEASENHWPQFVDWSSLSPQHLDRNWAWSIKKMFFFVAWTCEILKNER